MKIKGQYQTKSADLLASTQAPQSNSRLDSVSYGFFCFSPRESSRTGTRRNIRTHCPFLFGAYPTKGFCIHGWVVGLGGKNAEFRLSKIKRQFVRCCRRQIKASDVSTVGVDQRWMALRYRPPWTQHRCGTKNCRWHSGHR